MGYKIKYDFSENIETLKKSIDLIPSIEILKQQLDELSELIESAKPDAEIDELIYLWEKCIPVLPLTIHFHHNELSSSIRYFRGRFITPELTHFSLFRSYSYPPEHICKSNGRCNLASLPVFYCSPSIPTVLAELTPNAGDAVVISEWGVKIDRQVSYSPFVFSGIKDSGFVHTGFLKDIQHAFSANDLKFEKEEELTLINDWICNKFLTEKKPYHFTSYIANTILYDPRTTQKADMIWYPSNKNSIAFNVAIHPNFVDQNMFLNAIYLIQVNEHNSLSTKISLISKLFVIKNELIPVELEPEDFALFGSNNLMNLF